MPTDAADTQAILARYPLQDRDASILDFNLRVLHWAERPDVPLLERLRYLCIVSSNLDEFFEVRAEPHLTAWRAGTDVQGGMRHLMAAAHALVERQYAIYNEVLLPAMATRRMRIVSHIDRTEAQRKWVREYFLREVKPLLVPVALDPAHPFPQVANKSLNFIVQLKGKDAFGRSNEIAIVKVPRVLPRVLRLPERVAGGETLFVMLSSVIRAHLADLFPGRDVGDFSHFRVTRDSDLSVDEEEVQEPAHRAAPRAAPAPLRRGGAGGGVVGLLAGAGRVSAAPVQAAARGAVQGAGPGQPGAPAAADFAGRRAGAAVCAVPRQLPDAAATWRIGVRAPAPGRRADPPAVRELRRRDRFSARSRARPAGAGHQADHLPHRQRQPHDGPADRERSARGKEVTAVVELKARFDEEANINWAERLEQAGAQVVYGVVGLKTHAKMLLVTRREGRQLRRYGHLSTGNYNPRTAALYTDLSYLTADARLTSDMDQLFVHLASQSRLPRMQRMLLAPFTLHKQMLAQNRRRGAGGEEGRGGRIVAKMNALTDEALIVALLRAGDAGAKIDLIVRGACMLPAQLTDNIRVRSIIGRFLEHSRVFYFRAGADEQVWLSSPTG
jgi:polyphosphate kinase